MKRGRSSQLAPPVALLVSIDKHVRRGCGAHPAQGVLPAALECVRYNNATQSTGELTTMPGAKWGRARVWCALHTSCALDTPPHEIPSSTHHRQVRHLLLAVTQADSDGCEGFDALTVRQDTKCQTQLLQQLLTAPNPVRPRPLSTPVVVLGFAVRPRAAGGIPQEVVGGAG